MHCREGWGRGGESKGGWERREGEGEGEGGEVKGGEEERGEGRGDHQ